MKTTLRKLLLDHMADLTAKAAAIRSVLEIIEVVDVPKHLKPKKKRRRMSKAARKAIGDAQRRRWAKVRAKGK